MVNDKLIDNLWRKLCVLFSQFTQQSFVILSFQPNIHNLNTPILGVAYTCLAWRFTFGQIRDGLCLSWKYKASERDKTRKWKIEQRANVKNSSLLRKLRGQSPQNSKFKKSRKRLKMKERGLFLNSRFIFGNQNWEDDFFIYQSKLRWLNTFGWFWESLLILELKWKWKQVLVGM